MTERENRLKLQTAALDKVLKLDRFYGGITCYVKEELPGVSQSTLNALVRKGVLDTSLGGLGRDGPVYYFWTGKELE
jgi:hypothetical protein